MDGWTKFLLGLTAFAVIGYATMIYGSCARDPQCHIRHCGRQVCGVVHDTDNATSR